MGKWFSGIVALLGLLAGAFVMGVMAYISFHQAYIVRTGEYVTRVYGHKVPNDPNAFWIFVSLGVVCSFLALFTVSGCLWAVVDIFRGGKKDE